MAKFNYKKWVTENKYGKLNEQAGTMCYACQTPDGTGIYGVSRPLGAASIDGGTIITTPLSTLQQQSGYSAGGGAIFNGSYIGDPNFSGISSGCGLGSATGYFYDQAFVTGYCPSVGSDDVSDTGGSSPTGSIDTEPTGSVDTEIMCVGCEMVPNTNGLTLPSYGGSTYTPQSVASGEVSTVAYSSLDYQVNGGNGPSPGGYCGGTGGNSNEQFSPFSVVGSNDFANNIASICAASGSMYGSPEEPIEEPIEEPTGSFGTSGNYTAFDYPSGFDVTQWTVGFIDMIINHPNPCNFLQGRVNNFSNQLQGNIGPLQQNQLMQKLAVCQELFITTGCNNLQEQRKKYKLDPKAAAVIRRMAPKLKGLASRGKGVKKENKKISALKRIIKETLLELQEIENVSGQSCYYTNSGGAEENQDPNYCAQAGQPCTSGSDTERCICDCTGGSNPGVLRKPSKDIKRAPKRVAISNPTRGIRGKRLKK